MPHLSVAGYVVKFTYGSFPYRKLLLEFLLMDCTSVYKENLYPPQPVYLELPLLDYPGSINCFKSCCNYIASWLQVSLKFRSSLVSLSLLKTIALRSSFLCS